MKLRKCLIPALAMLGLLMSGCCTCRKTIVFITVPAEQRCETRKAAKSLASQRLPISRADSLFLEVRKASKKARVEAHETVKHLIP